MKRNARVLVIDDDARLRRCLELNLEAEGYQVVCAASGNAGFEALLSQQPDAVILDLMLPDVSGLELCQRMRASSDVTIIILTAMKDDSQLVQGLDVGADDYIRKPFSREELLARMRALLRRVGFSEAVQRSPDLVCGGVTLSCADRRLLRDGQTVKLSHTEFKLLYFLMANANRLLPNDELIARVWGAELVGNTDSLRTYIRYLRQKVEADPKNPRRIVAERGIGYMFTPES
jgi:DNA-binding response OmpR family regulator